MGCDWRRGKRGSRNAGLFPPVGPGRPRPRKSVRVQFEGQSKARSAAPWACESVPKKRGGCTKLCEVGVAFPNASNNEPRRGLLAALGAYSPILPSSQFYAADAVPMLSVVSCGIAPRKPASARLSRRHLALTFQNCLADTPQHRSGVATVTLEQELSTMGSSYPRPLSTSPHSRLTIIPQAGREAYVAEFSRDVQA